MSEDKPVHRYEGEQADVYWDARLCIHVQECGRSADELFVGGRQPWCQPDLVEVDNVVDVVKRCPSGSLTLQRKDGGVGETADKENVVFVTNQGPLHIRGNLDIAAMPADMPGVRFRASLCRCGQSSNKPFCDNSHEKSAFDDRGAVGETGKGNENASGPLKIRKAPNGPLLVSGNFAIVASSGRVAWHGTQAALCRCGESKNKPFCDGTHKKVGFQAD